MTQTKSKSYYNNVYKLLSEDSDNPIAINIINDWRSQHINTLNKASSFLERVVKKLNLKNVYIGQRLKRMPSIKSKIIRSNGMRLTEMQDIVGVRLVVNDLRELARVANLIRSEEIFNQNIVLKKEYNYIKNPKEDGYRCLHFIFQHTFKVRGVEVKRIFEVQLRTKAQHAWSTVVETLGTYLGENFKGGFGDENWKSFFTQSSYMFDWFEKFEFREKNLSKADIEKILKNSIQLKKVMIELNIYHLLKLLNKMTAQINYKISEMNSNGYAVILVDYIKHSSEARTFTKTSLKTAKAFYEKVESELKDLTQIQVMFVEITDLTNLRKAFPNFYIDVNDFNDTLSRYFNKLNDRFLEFEI